MKSFIPKAICTAVFTLAISFALFGQGASATLEERTLPVGEFNQVTVSGDFEITLVKGTYSVKVTSDVTLSPYVQVYVRSKNLYISFDEKSVPKELKKSLKSKNAPKPVFRATVSLPELNGISLKDNASLICTENFNGNNFALELSNKAQVKSLRLLCNNASLVLKQNAVADLKIEADKKIDVSCSNNSSLSASLKAEKVKLAGENSAKLTVEQKGGEETAIEAKGGSNITLSGEVNNLVLATDRNPVVDASALKAIKVSTKMNGGTATVYGSDKLELELSGGSSLSYLGTPEISIVKVVKSSVAPYSESSK